MAMLFVHICLVLKITCLVFMASRKSFTQLKIYTLIYEVENENF